MIARNVIVIATVIARIVKIVIANATGIVIVIGTVAGTVIVTGIAIATGIVIVSGAIAIGMIATVILEEIVMTDIGEVITTIGIGEVIMMTDTAGVREGDTGMTKASKRYESIYSSFFSSFKQ